MFYAFKPWVLATVVVQLRMQQMGYSPELGLDYYFLRKMHEKNRRVVELEDPEAQLRLMSRIPEDLQILMLKDTLVDFDLLESEIRQIFRFWETGDTGGMEDLLKRSRSQGPEAEQLYSVLLDRRNRDMAEGIDGLLKEARATGETCFIVVGAAHLVGEGNIIEELENRGYRCRQMTRTGG